MAIKRFSVRGFMAFVLPALLLFSAGCSNLSQKIAEKATDKALETASGGAVKVDTSNGGVTIKGSDGSVAMGGGSSRPESAPSDMPNVAGAKNFTWFGSSGSGMFAYELPGNDYKKACTDQIDLLLKAGWQKSDAYEMDVEKVMTKVMEKPGFSLSVTCSDNTDEGSTEYKSSVVLNKTKS